MLKKAVKSETVQGEAALIGSTYGESFFADETQQDVLNALTVIARNAKEEIE